VQALVVYISERMVSFSGRKLVSIFINICQFFLMILRTDTRYDTITSTFAFVSTFGVRRTCWCNSIQFTTVQACFTNPHAVFISVRYAVNGYDWQY
jgi:hypothetical protein